MKKFRYIIESLLLHTMMLIFRIMPVDIASATGGFIGRVIGPRLAASRKAMNNIKRALPDLSEEQHDQAIHDMWDNLGRVMAEYPHLEKIARERTEFIDTHKMIPEMQKVGNARNYIYVAAHLANWEVAAASILVQHNVPFNAIYRQPNNPMVRDLLDKARTMGGKFKTFPKSTKGMRDIVRTLKNGENLGILIDQKYNEGIAAPFFGHDAMTSTAFAELAQKFDAAIIPGRVERLEGAHFRITLFPVIDHKQKDGTPRAAADMIADAHRYLENWITQKPGQWLWLHRRWPDRKQAEEQNYEHKNL